MAEESVHAEQARTLRRAARQASYLAEQGDGFPWLIGTAIGIRDTCNQVAAVLESLPAPPIPKFPTPGEIAQGRRAWQKTLPYGPQAVGLRQDHAVGWQAAVDFIRDFMENGRADSCELAYRAYRDGGAFDHGIVTRDIWREAWKAALVTEGFACGAEHVRQAVSVIHHPDDPLTEPLYLPLGTRSEALRLAVEHHRPPQEMSSVHGSIYAAQPGTAAPDVVATARAFEAYLRGDGR